MHNNFDSEGDNLKIFDNYEFTRDSLKSDFIDCSDFLMREVIIAGRRALLCAMDGLVDSVALSNMVTEPLLSCKKTFDTAKEQFEYLKTSVIAAAEMNEAETFEDAEFFMMSGFIVVYLEGYAKALALGVQGWNRRSTDEPTNEAMVKGAKECFVEVLNDNKALLRKRLKTHKLKLRQLKLGSAAQVPVVIAYVEGRAEADDVAEIERRLTSAPLETVTDFGQLIAFSEQGNRSFFTTVGNTERPDVFASKLMEGRVGVMIEGTPFAIYTPYLFSDNFSSLDDYNNPPFYSSFIRILKYFAFGISTFLPALYVAVGSFHQEMIPTTLLYLVASSEETTPFPLLLEAIIIHLLYEIMREAGLRQPSTIGHAVSIIGAIVIGEAMVTAGLIGEPMLVVVALTAIASYVVYPLYESVAVLRLVFIVIAGLTGIYGLTVSAAALFVNICSLSSLGVVYTAPITPLTPSSVGDTLVRRGWRYLARRRVRIKNLEGTVDE
ncbi:MAG: spore germination protein [Ruminococcaceae bacterium]|nr:spore germination protein [Oscillospiraceae bacterium]